MKHYQDIRIKRSSQILNFSKSLGSMQADRSGKNQQVKVFEDMIKGEVLMYGTLPIMMPGADHDYKEDIRRATEGREVPTVTAEEAQEALDSMFGLNQPSLKSRDEESYEAWMLLMNGV
jgi:hypothetical protein